MPYGQDMLPGIEEEIDIIGWGDEDAVVPFQYSISSYGADFPVESLVRRLNNGDIIIPSFQRSYVWSLTDASRFIETLLLGLPVPGIFLSREYETQRLLVIDGQQRLKTLQFFYNGIFEPTGKAFALSGVQADYVGASYRTLIEADRRRLDDYVIHLTIIQQDEPSDDDSSIYHVFERLNTTGRPLYPQEIRACLFHGEFNEVLAELNRNTSWRTIFGPVSKRMRDRELILRFLALHFSLNQYRKPMKRFLNLYMKANRHLERQNKEQLSGAFDPTINVVLDSLGRDAFKPRRVLNAAVFDAVMVGIARRLEKGTVEDLAELKAQYEELLADPKFERAVEGATTDEENVRQRVNLAIQRFESVA